MYLLLHAKGHAIKAIEISIALLSCTAVNQLEVYNFPFCILKYTAALDFGK